MAKRILVYFMVSLIFLPGIFADEQEEESGVLYEKVLRYLPFTVSANQIEESARYCKVLMVGATWEEPEQADWASLDFVSEYFTGDVWNMCIVAVNYSNQDVPIKVEFELRWWDGGRRIYRRWSRNLEAGTVTMYLAPITNQIKQLGLFTLIGGIGGNYVGTNNIVKTQLLIY